MTEQIQRVCPSCGASASDFRFCPSCGRSLGSSYETSTPADRQASAASNVGEAATDVAPRAIEIPALTNAAQEHLAPGVSENGRHRSVFADTSAPTTVARLQTTEPSWRADAKPAEAKDDVAPQLPETVRFGYVPAVVEGEAHDRSDVAGGQDSEADDGVALSPADDAPAEAVAASYDRAQLSEQPSPTDQPPAASEPESPTVNVVPPPQNDQPSPRQAAPRPVAPIPAAPKSSSHRAAFVCLAAVIGLILVMLSRGRRDHA
jgi:hypothetical protein